MRSGTNELRWTILVCTKIRGRIEHYYSQKKQYDNILRNNNTDSLIKLESYLAYKILVQV